MTKTVVQCDFCGREAAESNFSLRPPKGWYQVVSSKASDAVLHFCTDDCLLGWVRKRSEEREAA